MVYQGSKSRYAKYIVPILQSAIDENNITTFIDGCCGGCNIIDKIKCDNRIAIDNDKYLIALLRHMANDEIECTSEEIPSREEWNRIKENKDEYPDWYVGFIKNTCSFSAKGFIGGYCTISKHGTVNEYLNRRKRLIEQAPNLKNIIFRFDDINNLTVSNCVIYIDPPYNHTVKYDSLIENPFDYDKFWDTVRRLSKDNLVFISEQQAPNDFEIIWYKDSSRQIGGRVKECKECLFKYKGEMINHGSC